MSGRKSQKLGADFEAFIDMQHAMAGMRGALAHVVHNMPPSRFVDGKLIYSKAGVADYTGVLYGGLYLAAEAKSVAPGECLAKSRISLKQKLHLDRVIQAGGFAYLLVEFRSEDFKHRRYAILWDRVPWKKKRTAESLDEADLVKCESQIRMSTDKDYLARDTDPSSNVFHCMNQFFVRKYASK